VLPLSVSSFGFIFLSIQRQHSWGLNRWVFTSRWVYLVGPQPSYFNRHLQTARDAPSLRMFWNHFVVQSTVHTDLLQRPPTVCPRETLFPPRTGSGHDDDYDVVAVVVTEFLLEAQHMMWGAHKPQQLICQQPSSHITTALFPARPI